MEQEINNKRQDKLKSKKTHRKDVYTSKGVRAKEQNSQRHVLRMQIKNVDKN